MAARRVKLANLRWAALILALLAGLALAWRYAPEPVARELFRQSAAVRAPIFGARIVATLDRGAQSFKTGEISSDDIGRLLAIVSTEDIYRMTLRDNRGRAFWSNRQSDFGATSAAAPLVEVMHTGEPYFEHLHAPVSEVLGWEGPAAAETGSVDHAGRDVNHQVLPVTLNGELVGTIETYQDVTAVNNAWLSTIRWTVGVVGALISALGSAAALRLRKAGLARAADSLALSKAENEFLSEQLRMGREVRLLGDLNEWLQSSKSLDELFYMVTRFMSHLLPDISGSIYVYSNSRDVLDGACSWNGGVHKAHIHPEDCWGLRRGRTYAFADSEVKFLCGHVHDEHPKNYICIPFLAHGETVGMMHLAAPDGMSGDDFTARRKLAQMCAEQISLAIANVRMRDELHYQAIRDSLTGLYNRRHMMDTLRRRIETRKAAPFSIISIDVDHFKNFNDNHGHDAGDVVLRAVGEVLAAACNGNDIACRMGGEELMLMLSDIDHATALARADALRQAVSDLTVRYGDKTLPQITVSVGVADYPGHGALPQDVIRAADEALYAAKAVGRNCVVSASDVVPGSLMPLARIEDDPGPMTLAAE